ncbi:twinfilin [Cylas formicarius]|uniref:twinfilin n=1 Tax=Cylas formicarius TaxID=197179 RepID=UPI0029588711|nr:twinfilin [Cylas formicarius]
MSHQTGIKANAELRKFFADGKTAKIRLAKVAIEDEQLVLKEKRESKSNWEKDYERYVVPLVEENQPSYILYRLDAKNSVGYDWLLISWCPDTAPVRQKMLYASTKATLKQEFGSSEIKDELHGTVVSDITLDGFKRHLTNVVRPPPLSMREEELQEIKKTEVNTDISVDTKQTLGTLAFPLTDAATKAIKDMAAGLFDYLQFKINISEESVHLAESGNIAVESLPGKVPEDSGRYHLYKFKHTHEGDYMESVVFIYSMPGYSCPIKERMLYSSCKNYLTDLISSLGLEITKKLEVDSGSELTSQYLYDVIHPTHSLHRPKFAKPKGPPGRGPKRMTKHQDAAE